MRPWQLTMNSAHHLPAHISPSNSDPVTVLFDIHTPETSTAVQHSITEENLNALFRKLSKKDLINPFPVGSGCLKYEYNDIMWNLDDDSDYAIFVWRQQQLQKAAPVPINPILHLRHPSKPLPTPAEYRNPAFFLFKSSQTLAPDVNGIGTLRSSSRASSVKSRKSKTGDRSESGILAHKKAFMDFQASNGVRTITGSIGPVNNVRMLLRNGYRHVYMSRRFAVRHGFVPTDAQPGSYGYSGLVNIGKWPLTIGQTKTLHSVYLSEETHFDVVLGRSFMEKRGIKTDPLDMTNIICLDTGEKLECEIVVIRDGKGEIITVT